MIKFRAKEFSSHILSDAITGAKIGAAGGTLSSAVLSRLSYNEPDKVEGRSLVGRIKDKLNGFAYNKEADKDGSIMKKSLEIAGAGALIGAALGAVAGAIKDIGTVVNRKNTVDNRLMSKVISKLKSKGANENVDFTRNPKAATQLKSKVCIVISKYSDDLRVLINTVNDPKLESLTNRITKNVPNGSIKNNTTSDKFNELILSTISSGADADLITEITLNYIKAKYPVYLVEVG